LLGNQFSKGEKKQQKSQRKKASLSQKSQKPGERKTLKLKIITKYILAGQKVYALTSRGKIWRDLNNKNGGGEEEKEKFKGRQKRRAGRTTG